MRVPLALVALGLASACAKKNDPDGSLPAAAADAGVRIKPVDHLAPGELVEGTDTAMGLAVPKVMTVSRVFDDVAFVDGPVPPELVARYVEARVKGTAPTKTSEGHVFEKVSVTAAPTNPSAPSKTLRIVVAKAATGTGSRMAIRDVTPPPVVNTPPDEESRWRAVGLKPNGEPLDRTKLR